MTPDKRIVDIIFYLCIYTKKRGVSRCVVRQKQGVVEEGSGGARLALHAGERPEEYARVRRGTGLSHLMDSNGLRHRPARQRSPRHSNVRKGGSISHFCVPRLRVKNN